MDQSSSPNVNHTEPFATPQADNTTISTITTTSPTTPLFSPRVRGLDREIYNLTTAYNPDPRVHMEDLVHYAFTTITPAMDIYPSTYFDAMKHKDNLEWWKAMKLEFTNAETKHVWKIIKKSDLPKGRKLVGNRWVYTQKDDGRFRARTVAKGYSQIPGRDFKENHDPVLHDTTIHMILVMKIVYNLKKQRFDI